MKLRKAACMNSRINVQVLNLLKYKLQGGGRAKKHLSVCNQHSTKLCRHRIYVIFSKMWLRHLNNGFK